MEGPPKHKAPTSSIPQLQIFQNKGVCVSFKEYLPCLNILDFHLSGTSLMFRTKSSSCYEKVKGEAHAGGEMVIPKLITESQNPKNPPRSLIFQELIQCCHVHHETLFSSATSKHILKSSREVLYHMDERTFVKFPISYTLISPLWFLEALQMIP